MIPYNLARDSFKLKPRTCNYQKTTKLGKLLYFVMLLYSRMRPSESESPAVFRSLGAVMANQQRLATALHYLLRFMPRSGGENSVKLYHSYGISPLTACAAHL